MQAVPAFRLFWDSLDVERGWHMRMFRAVSHKMRSRDVTQPRGWVSVMGKGARPQCVTQRTLALPTLPRIGPPVCFLALSFALTCSHSVSLCLCLSLCLPPSLRPPSLSVSLLDSLSVRRLATRPPSLSVSLLDSLSVRRLATTLTLQLERYDAIRSPLSGFVSIPRLCGREHDTPKDDQF